MCVLAGGLRGATIVDSLDTLYIMGLTEDYKEAKEWIHTNLDLDVVRTCLTHKQLFSTFFSTEKYPSFTVSCQSNHTTIQSMFFKIYFAMGIRVS